MRVYSREREKHKKMGRDETEHAMLEDYGQVQKAKGEYQ